MTQGENGIYRFFLVHFLLASCVSDFTPISFSTWADILAPKYQKYRYLDDHKQVLPLCFRSNFLLVGSVFVEICTPYQDYDRYTI